MWRSLVGIIEQTVRLAWRNLVRQRRRTGLALAIVGGGVIAYLLAGGFIQWALWGMREATIHSQLGHIQITRPGFYSHGVADPYRHLLPREPQSAGLEGTPGMQTVTPRLTFSGLASKDETTISFLGEGIDPEREAPITRSITIVKGRDLPGAGPAAVLLGEGLASNLGAEPGDTLVLLGTPPDGGVNAVEATVAGIFVTATGKAYDDSVLRAPIGLAQQLMRVDGATTWVMLLDRTERTDEALAALRTRLPAQEFELVPWQALADFYNKTVTLFSSQMGVVRLLIALIVILSISNTLSMAVLERTGEIGTAMAIGVRRRGVLGLFLTEGMLLGVVGGILGVSLGYLLGATISAIGIPMPPPPGASRGYTGQIAITPTLAVDGFLLAFFTTLLASLFPAWKASRMNIVDALRHQR